MEMIHLLFPGVAETRLFPYLSLQTLKSFLKERGVPTQYFQTPHTSYTIRTI